MAAAQPPPLAVILGASVFPRSPRMMQGKFFLNSAEDVRRYLMDGRGLNLPEERLLWLFDNPRSPSEQLLNLAKFLAGATKAEPAATDLLLFYIGHGFFSSGGDQAYRLAVRYMHELSPDSTSIRFSELAQVVKEHAMHLRRYLVLDCCFSGSALREFQSTGLAGAATAQVREELPQRGTALLCAASANLAARAPEGASHTMFSAALIQALRSGHERCGPQLSFSELGALVRENIRMAHPNDGVRPDLHSPDQREGDIASLPMFPNPAYRKKPRAAAEGAQRSERRPISTARTPAAIAEQTRGRAGSTEKSRLEAQEAAAERILKRSARRRAQEAERKRLKREKADEENARWRASEEERQRKSEVAAKAAVATQAVVAAQPVLPAVVTESTAKAPVAAIWTKTGQSAAATTKESANLAVVGTEEKSVSNGALLALLVVAIAAANLAGFYVGGYLATLRHGVSEAVAPLVAGVAGALYSAVAGSVDSRLRYGTWVSWPGFILGFHFLNHAPPGGIPPGMSDAIGASMMFLIGVWLASDTGKRRANSPR